MRVVLLVRADGRSLAVLNVADNAIASIDEPTSPSFWALRQLSLGSNPISSLDSLEALAVIAPELERLTLSTEPLNAGTLAPIWQRY